MSESEWRGIGVQQSQGWVHYMTHQPGMCQILSAKYSLSMTACMYATLYLQNHTSYCLNGPSQIRHRIKMLLCLLLIQEHVG